MPHAIDPLDSPCVGVCTIYKRGEISVCGGCWRTMNEIARWRELDRSARAKVLEACDARERDYEASRRDTNR